MRQFSHRNFLCAWPLQRMSLLHCTISSAAPRAIFSLCPSACLVIHRGDFQALLGLSKIQHHERVQSVFKSLKPAQTAQPTMKTRNLRQSGWTLLEIMIVVSFIGFLAAIAIPNFIHARSTSNEKVCINNLRQIDAAAQTWAAENNKQSMASYTLNDIKAYFQRSIIPQCPAAGQYGPNFTVGSAPTCTTSGHVLQ